MTAITGACAIKNYGLVIYGLTSKLVCLFVQVKCVFVLATILQRNLSITRKLRVRNVL